MTAAYTISTDPARLDVALVHDYLSHHSYWAPGISRELVERSIQNSLCFGVYAPDGQQVGFARVVTDRATFAYLCDVFVLEAHRGQGLSKLLMTHIMAHPELQGLRRWLLGTRDAHSLYAQFGFTPLASPPRFMENAKLDPYRQAPQ
ncbi:GNAT family N-acetyltransferase [Hymenobacter busanensis]|uniref:GNAT family N-acetyltransferase n=1 Tax=Hymenobacter busanensis TaxID=2607656 RepID=A0A7L4ZYS5_9BACT|nr:GNAT family N-acetyltransferase [Hymenobacter busanensis]KAA9331484.1 GNAT family N-acetyltransferase [Hymenobacter busanensis]QHJ08639.1 GNAT family N-acetyltransferase [Hymenobacter busanensis]